MLRLVDCAIILRVDRRMSIFSSWATHFLSEVLRTRIISTTRVEDLIAYEEGARKQSLDQKEGNYVIGVLEQSDRIPLLSNTRNCVPLTNFVFFVDFASRR